MRRRDFLRIGVGAGGALVGGAIADHSSGLADQADQSTTRPAGRPHIALLAHPDDAIAAAIPVRWALDELARHLAAAGAAVHRIARVEDAPAESRIVVATGRAHASGIPAVARASAAVADAPEALGLTPAVLAGHPAVIASGADARGLTYALLDLVDRVEHARTIDAALTLPAPVVEQPANVVRSVMRQFTSETFDTPWLHDREMWPAYLGMLARHRFNRLHLGFGLGYDSLTGVTDSDLVFVYPFLLAVPGYGVRVTNLGDADRGRNLETLRFISDAAVARGLDFQLGLWMHGYQLTNSPRAKYIVEGLTPETHAAYCRDALTAVLRACPAISAVALRIHGESGIAEGSYDFWATVFDGVARAGRRIEIDLHAKGLDQTMTDHALATGMPVNVSPKYWAEHLGLPYHQAAIRDLEMPVAGRTGRGLMTLSEGARSFTRYGYADFLRDDRKYTVRHRVFAGTQKLLASGDPVWAAAYGRMFSFCGSTGMDLMEPLTCRGRRGTAVSGTTRIGYTDHRLEPRWDWEKYAYWYRTWGRLTYNPNTASEVCEREFGDDSAGSALARSLGHASRILPIVTTAHLPSAACDAYWPEVYWNQPLVEAPGPNPYGDTPAPKTFANVSPIDPQLFSRMSDFADELLTGPRTGKYSPVEVATWLEDLALTTRQDLERARRVTLRAAPPSLERVGIDIEIQAGLAEFFAARFRSGVLAVVFDRTNDRRALEASIAMYTRARTAWTGLADVAARAYGPELAASEKVSNRGAWPDRLPAIDQDIARLAARLAGAPVHEDSRVPAVIAAIVAPVRQSQPDCRVEPIDRFRRGQPLDVTIAVIGSRQPASARLWYRHVNQAERFQSALMTAVSEGFQAHIPAEYTDTPYPLQYYVEFTHSTGETWLHPGLRGDLSNLPYVVLRGA